MNRTGNPRTAPTAPAAPARRIGLAAIALLAAAPVQPAAAQHARQSARPDSIAPPLQRRAFAWPEALPRDPLRPAAAAPSGSGRPDEVALLGILHHPDPRMTIVLLGVGTRVAETAGQEAGPRARRVARLRLGEERGGLEVVEIGSRRVVVRFGSGEGAGRRAVALDRPTLRIES